MNLIALNEVDERRKRNQMDIGPQKGIFLDQFLKYRRKKPQFRLVVTTNLQRNKMFVIAQPLFGGHGGL